MASNDRFFSQKIKTFFHRFDIDKNGMIEVEDFEKWAGKLAAINKISPERTAALQKSIMAIWDVYFLPADTNKDGSVEIPELVVHMRSALTDPLKRAAIEATLPLIFDAIDTNGNGGIEVGEFANYFTSFGLKDAAMAKQVFEAMDSNHDESLSKEEFTAFGYDFFLGSDATSPSRFFFGPLI